MRVCVCVSVERKRERESERAKERECVYVWMYRSRGEAVKQYFSWEDWRGWVEDSHSEIELAIIITGVKLQCWYLLHPRGRCGEATGARRAHISPEACAGWRSSMIRGAASRSHRCPPAPNHPGKLLLFVFCLNVIKCFFLDLHLEYLGSIASTFQIHFFIFYTTKYCVVFPQWIILLKNVNKNSIK